MTTSTSSTSLPTLSLLKRAVGLQSVLWLLGIPAYSIGVRERFRYILDLHHPSNHVSTDAMPITALAEILTDASTHQQFFHTVWPPGMSAFLALNFVFDPTAHSAAICQFLASAIVPLVVGRVAHVAYGERAGWIALTMASLHTGFVHYGALFLAEGLFQLAVAVAVWTTVVTLASAEPRSFAFARSSPSGDASTSPPLPSNRSNRWLVVRGLASGLAWGLAFSLRSNALPIALFAATWLAVRFVRQRRREACAALAAGALGFMLIFAPLAHRCTSLTGNFCPGASNGAMNIALGHAPDVVGLHFRPLSSDRVGGQDSWSPPARQPHGFQGVGEVPGSIYDSGLILSWVKEQFLRSPRQFVIDSFGNTFDLFGSSYWPEDYRTVKRRRMTVLKQAFFLLVLVPGLAMWGVGIRRTFSWRRTTDIDSFFVACILGLFLLAALTLGEARYRIPFDVIFIVLAARAFAGRAAVPAAARRPPSHPGSSAVTAVVLAVFGALLVATAHPRFHLATRLTDGGVFVSEHRSARAVAGVLRLSEIASPRTNETPWNAAGNFQFQCTPSCPELRIDLEGTLHSPSIEVSADHNDRYEVAFFRRGDYVGRVAWGVFEGQDGLRVVQYAVPEHARAEGYDAITVRPLYGDGNYSIGHVRFF